MLDKHATSCCLKTRSFRQKIRQIYRLFLNSYKDQVNNVYIDRKKPLFTLRFFLYLAQKAIDVLCTCCFISQESLPSYGAPLACAFAGGSLWHVRLFDSLVLKTGNVLFPPFHDFLYSFQLCS